MEAAGGWSCPSLAVNQAMLGWVRKWHHDAVPLETIGVEVPVWRTPPKTRGASEVR